MRLKQRIYIILPLTILGYFVLNSISIYKFSSTYFEHKSDVAIVLGAATSEGNLSSFFKDRINHSLFLYKKGVVNKISFTGGFGKGQKKSNSQIAKNYALKNGVPNYSITKEEKSQFTIQNIIESKIIMDAIGLKTVLIITDPFHMKRAIKLTENSGIDCKPSPTQATKYQSTYPKTKRLLYETFFFTLREIVSLF
jgi:uncharacterized SAM-binding protein YcdF (DUF218 family)